VNSSSFTISELYVSPSSSGSWGPDQLTSTIAPGGTFTLTGITPGTYDLRAVASDGTTFWQSMAVSITAGGTFTWTLLNPVTGSLRVVNSSSISVFFLYVTPASLGCTSGIWGTDQLGANTIAPGASFTLTGITPGSYDLRATNSTGTSFWRSCGVSINGGATYVWTLLP
jgi:hypothetical protein